MGKYYSAIPVAHIRDVDANQLVTRYQYTSGFGILSVIISLEWCTFIMERQNAPLFPYHEQMKLKFFQKWRRYWLML